VPVLGTAAHLVVRTGVRATYRLHDRFLSNPEAKQAYEQHPAVLDDVQQKVVDALKTEGIAVLPFADLLGQELWDELAASSAEFARAVERDGGTPAKKTKKEYLLRAYAPGPVDLADRNPWLRAGTDPRLLDVVNDYLGLWSKLSYVDQWYTVPREAVDRVASQRWHRDYNDKHLLKAFLYMTDVDEGAGPFEYVAGTMIGGNRFADVYPWEIFGEDLYPPDGELQRKIPAAESRLVTGREGTLILCDTTGFHRGGFASERPRIMGVWNYVSPASLASLSERNFRATASPDATDAVRYALS
jgi:hypothetical protein